MAHLVLLHVVELVLITSWMFHQYFVT